MPLALDIESPKKQGLPRRDWILLPLLSLFTIAILGGSTELISRRVFSSSKTLLANCMILDDASTGPRAIPNSTCYEKNAESPLIEYKFDRCGYRSSIGCAPKPPGVYRIVLIGSSAVLGEHARVEDIFATLLPGELSQRTQRKVDVYNEGLGWGFPPTISLRFNQVLAAQPDMILWVLAAGDVEGSAVVIHETKTERARFSQSLSARAWRIIKAAFSSESAATAIPELFGRTRTAIVLRHYLYLSQSQHVMSTLAGDDQNFGFLKATFSPEWEDHLHQFDLDVASVSDRARAAGIPLVATFTPYSTQASMISMGEWPPEFDPYKLDNELRKIIERHGGIYLDTLPQYRSIPNPERGYLPVDGHANAAGHAVSADTLVTALTSGAAPALRAPAPPLPAPQEGR